MHVFPYSRRPGTTANLLPDHVPEPEKKARLNETLALARESAASFRRRALGGVAAVLWEEATPAPDGGDPVWDGLTDNYIRVRTRSGQALANRLLPVRLTGEQEDALTGELLPAGLP
jgi:threonylcarbamoyladenosine tRNA methylthiotransferase MtaB